ncbi:ankyrin repeat domain-containing protein [Wolbachia endosymbiont (group A) of Bombylius major]|uniref:hypothetical protein n=1 Tax=Wolbachia endosymbiont (group A) of Bombylius major TaxID=2953988 RepID=UPI002231878A|nr:hypothetical protein [Wolbachia endosymbiont (group A) of Bombylius major]
MTYEEIKEFVTNNPNITAEEFGEKLKQNGTTDTNICDLFMGIIRSGKGDTLNDRDTFLKTVELLVKSNIKIDIGDTASKTVLDHAVIGGQPDVIKIFLDSSKFDQERKSNALSTAINGGKVQEFEVFLDYVDHASIQGHLNAAPCNENTSIMKAFLDNKRFTGQEKAHALSDAVMDGNVLKVKLLLDHMTSIPEDSIRCLLEIKKESKLSLEKELKIDSEFKGNPNNPDHRKYFSNLAIIKLLESAINGDNRNHDNEIPVVTEEINNGQAAMPSNERETKYKESKNDFYTSLTKDAVGVVITGLFIAAAVMIPFVAGAIVCGIIAALVAIYTGLHIKNSTLPSYREMEENKVEHVNSQVVKI